MPECTVCGEKNFDEIDGHYFCTICNTQSQDVRVMVADDDNFNDFKASLIIRDKKVLHETKKKDVYYGRPWSIYEAYQLIIQSQVTALIQLGAHPDLKDVVFTLWTNYLSKLGVAFSDNPPLKELQLYGRQRELFPGTTRKAKIKNVLGRQTRKKNFGMSQQSIKKDAEADLLEGIEFEEGDNPIDNDDPLSGEELDWVTDEEEIEMEVKRWGRKRKTLHTYSVKRVSMMTTLSVCYLGLMYTNPLTTFGDIIRWVKSNKIPYKDTRHILAEDMKFFTCDREMFGMGHVPSSDVLRITAGSLAYFLQLKKFPEFPFQQLICKYLVELNLPAEMLAYVINLTQAYPVPTLYKPTRNLQKIPFWEGNAMSYIVIVLKLLLGINDTTERLCSEYSRQIMKITNCKFPLFIWDEWVTYTRDMVETRKHGNTQEDQCLTEGDITEQLCRDVEAIYTQDSSVYRLYQTSVRDSIRKPFVQLADRWREKRDCIQTFSSACVSLQHNNRDDRFHLVNDTQQLALDNTAKQQGQHNGTTQQHWTIQSRNSCGNMEIKQNGEYFQRCTVQHLVSPETFLDDLEKLCFETEVSDSCSSSHDGEYVKATLFPATKRRRLYRSSGDAIEISTISAKEQYYNLITKLADVKQKIHMDFHCETESTCMSYTLLLQICSDIIACSVDKLQMEISDLEKVLFFELNDLSSKERWKVIRRRKWCKRKLRNK